MTRFTRGSELLNTLEKTKKPSILKALEDIAPDLARFTIEFAYGDIYSRSGLSSKHRELATIASLSTLGHAKPQLKFHIVGGLNIGCTPTEIVETLIHIVIYAGFPAGLNAISIAKEVFLEQNILPLINVRTETSPEISRYQTGLNALNNIDGQAGIQVIESLKEIAPDLAKFIIEFPFGDIYSRSGLDLISREIVTIAALTTLGSAQAQLKVHSYGLLNVGGTKEQLIETMIHLAVYAGFPASINAISVAKEVLNDLD